MHDVFIHNAVIHDGERFTDADALLVKAGRISWIGPGACAPAHDGVPSVDLEGRTVLPALCDVHTHPSWIAATVRSVPCVSPIVNTIEEMIEALRRHPLAGRGPEAWITGFGYDEGKLAEHRTPHHRGPRPRQHDAARVREALRLPLCDLQQRRPAPRWH